MSTTVRKRRVFYLSGFDPRGASHYHRIYRTEGQRQSAVNGLNLGISGRCRVAPHVHGWDIHATDAAGRVTLTTYEFLSWARASSLPMARGGKSSATCWIRPSSMPVSSACSA